MAVQQSLIIIKPDGLVKSLTGNILTALSETKFIIVAAKIVKPPRELVEKHYEEHKGKPFYAELVNYLTGKFHTDRAMFLVYQGENAIEKIREIAGATNPEKAHPASIRGKYGRIHSETHVFENVIHASDSPESAEREIKLWFKPEEVVERIYPVSKKKIKDREELVWK
ncbi:nucleoside-diphosphate kinase [Candidatus Woesearchaeota archaeon]|nr:nucleoside-diphosphate kinase [Candidatus Woesearchaeota archaeon]